MQTLIISSSLLTPLAFITTNRFIL